MSESERERVLIFYILKKLMHKRTEIYIKLYIRRKKRGNDQATPMRKRNHQAEGI
uniref:Uncharacterized protein n=1 Tax=Lepeophtheirus salmonis TaxID=72036 RepID=A0A0K2TFM5_LEPSM